MGWSPLPETASDCHGGHCDVPPTRRGDHDEDYDDWYGFGKERVGCKYSTEPYDIDIKDITDDLFVKSGTSYNLSIPWRSPWSLA